MLKALVGYLVYILRFILFMEFLNLAREPKLTILGSKLFQTFTTRSLKKFSRLFVRQ